MKFVDGVIKPEIACQIWKLPFNFLSRLNFKLNFVEVTIMRHRQLVMSKEKKSKKKISQINMG
jgi:hypothetical protein